MPFGIMNRIPRTLPPNKTPTGTRCIQITIPDDDEWERDLNSVIQRELATWLSWERDTGKNGTVVARQWKQALKTWRHCDESNQGIGGSFNGEIDMFRRVCVDDVCYIEFECCPGEWVRLANSDQLNKPPQPGGGTPQPQPGGGMQKYCNTLFAGGILYLPTTVSTGDVITLASSDGSGWDGTETDSTGNPIFRCLDGSIFFSGECGGGSHVDGGDPVPSANHMTLVAKINGSYYYISGLGFTVPAGISNASVVLQVNDSNISDNQGSYSLCVNVTNNQATTWCRKYDFRIANYGMTTEDVGFWSPGVGWVGAFQNSVSQTVTTPGFNFPSTTLTSIELLYTKNTGSGANDETAIYGSFPSGAALANVSGVHGTGLTFTWTGSQVATGFAVSVNAGTTPGAQIEVIQVILSGIGAIPPGGVAC